MTRMFTTNRPIIADDIDHDIIFHHQTLNKVHDAPTHASNIYSTVCIKSNTNDYSSMI